jgi:RNA polymerase sigma-70 factor (ECF subfamily)
VVELEIINAAKAGDQEAMVTVLRSIEKPVYRIAFYMLHNEQDALEAAQDVLLKVYTKLGTYEQQSKFSTWVQRITTNVCLDRIRKQRVTISIEENNMDFIGNQDVEQHVMSQFDSEEVRAAIDQLSPTHRMIIIYRYLQELNYGEIAEIMDLPINTVKSHLFRARKKLHSLLLHFQYEKGGVGG